MEKKARVIKNLRLHSIFLIYYKWIKLFMHDNGNHFPLRIDQSSYALLTDLYQLTMSYGYWKSGLENKESVFHLFFRRTPFKGGYAIAVGLEQVIQYLENFKFDNSDIAYLATLKNANQTPFFSNEFLNYLIHLKFTCDIDAVPEGTVVFADEPLLRIQGPLIQCQILESCLLNLINFPSLIATKASRICMAANGNPVLEFGLRRAQGINGALTASRSAYIGGCESTSNVMAGKIYDIPVRGTHSHSWVMVFETELESFHTYAEYLPDNTIFLVDTYNSIEGVKKAIEVGKTLLVKNKKLFGIRLDSGDLAQLSIESRRLLDDAGLVDALIVASNDLDEHVITELKLKNAKIDMWGVGTHLVTAKDQAALEGVYKLSAIRNPGEAWTYKIKLSEQQVKISNPGVLQIRRYHDTTNGANKADLIYDINRKIPKNVSMINQSDLTCQTETSELAYKDLLVPIFRQGNCIYHTPSIHEIRQNCQMDLSKFSAKIKQLTHPEKYPVYMEKSLFEAKTKLINDLLASSL